MNLGELRDEVYRYLRDSDREFVVPGDVDAWLNQAQRDLAHRLKLFETEAVVTDGGALPEDFVEAQQLLVGNSEQPARFVDDDTFRYHLASGYLPVGTIARITGNILNILPSPTETVTLRYVSTPPDMAGDGDESALPTEVEWKAVHFAVAQAYYKEAEVGIADRFQAMYENGLPPAPLGQHKRIPGPFDLSFAPSVWDEQGSHVS